MSEEIKETGSAAPEQNTAAEKPAPERSAGDNRNTSSGSHNSSSRSDGRNDSRDSRSNNNDRRQRFPRFKKKVCKFCHNADLPIDYKRPDILVRFLTDRGKILPRRITGTCAKHQRRVAAEVKRARMIALLPFVEQ